MIREEIEIRNAIDTIFPISPSGNDRTYEQALMASGFEEGIKWADNNPKSPWINVKEDLPCNHEELIDIDTRSIHQKTLFVIVWNGKFIDIDFMFYKKGKWEWVCNNSNTHWFPIPEPPKE